MGNFLHDVAGVGAGCQRSLYDCGWCGIILALGSSDWYWQWRRWESASFLLVCVCSYIFQLWFSFGLTTKKVLDLVIVRCVHAMLDTELTMTAVFVRM